MDSVEARAREEKSIVDDIVWLLLPPLLVQLLFVTWEAKRDRSPFGDKIDVIVLVFNALTVPTVRERIFVYKIMA